ncbi:hypothetical protein [Sandaracinus amylolyticus]|uniref:Uncharacterized protein n=1 Tax=Sandaracinus amylolyticus TaxID=927083 RepID=A0A0F6W910_9BACT|nr:hypothetical protein [Sandaracinus amylolyticus]AKF10473.1 hypothetical protein DB32_007622 [Sandaracinus amylolyticus]
MKWVVFPLVIASLSLARPAHAQEMPRASLLQTGRSGGIEEGTARATDRMLRERIDSLHVVDVSGAVVLDLEQVQLAFGCMGESVSCLEQVAHELDVQVLVVPSLDRAGDEIVATLLRFDARDGSQQRVVRRVQSDAALLQEVEPMLRELFGLPPQAEGQGTLVGTPEGERDTTPVAPVREPAGISPWPIVVMSVGALALVGGGIAGAMSSDDASAFRDADPSTQAEADEAHDRLSRAETEATAANVLFVSGGVLLAGGLAWLLAAGREDGSSVFALAPYAGPEGGGVVMAGRFALGGGL